MPKRDYGPGEGVVPMTKNAQLEDVDTHAVGINTPTKSP